LFVRWLAVSEHGAIIALKPQRMPAYNLPMSAHALPADANICRNCGSPAPGAFCPSCGQETDTRLPTVRQFMRDATGRLIAFDGRLWRTLFALVAKPGFLTREYFDGRRRRYVRPTRLFLVMSVILFAVLRLATPPIPFDERTIIVDEPEKASTPASAARNDGVAANDARVSADPEEHIGVSIGDRFQVGLDKELNFVVTGSPNFFSDQLRVRLDRFNRLPRAEKGEQITAGMIRYGPYAMFVLLPAFAWLQQISYLGRARRYPGRPRWYVEHLVYATHVHTFLFLAAIVAILARWAWLRWLLAAWVVYYVLRAKREIYRGSRLGSVLRTLFVAVIYTILFFFATIALIFPAILLR
jgi:hypothetical protein